MICRFLSTLFLLLVVPVLSAQQNASPVPNTPPAKQRAADETFAKLPLGFEPNRGQANMKAQFVAHGTRSVVYLAGPDAIIAVSQANKSTRRAVSSAALRMHLEGADTASTAVAELELPGKANYLTGMDRSRWQTNLPTFAQVRLPAVYRGIDLLYYGHGGALEYDFLVAPNADPNRIRLSFAGGTPKLAADGSLMIPVGSGSVRFGKPAVYQRMGNSKVSIVGEFVLLHAVAGLEIGFQIGAYDHERELVIDPVLLYEGSVGMGAQSSAVAGIATDASGALYLTGTTLEATYPSTTGAFQTTCGMPSAGAASVGDTRCASSQNQDFSSAFVTKISADGKSLVYSTYLHGAGGVEVGNSIAVDSAGIAYLLGTTSSNDFPITSDALQPYCAPQYPITGQMGTTATYGPETSECDNNYVGSGGGSSYTQHAPGSLYLAKLNATGTALLYATFFGGSEGEYPTGLALDSSNNMLLSHYTLAHSVANLYPTPNVVGLVNPLTTANAFQSTAADEIVGMLTKLSNDGHTLMYSTFLGGSSGALGGQVQTLALAVASGTNGVAFLGGQTMSASFPTTPGAMKTGCLPTTGAYAAYNCQTYYGFVTAFNTAATSAAAPVYSTYVGGDVAPVSNSDITQVNGLAADAANNVLLAGYTYTSDYPTTPGAYKTTCVPRGSGSPANVCDVSFLTKLNPTGSSPLWSTFYQGAQGLTQAMSVAVDPKGVILLSGYAQHGFYSIPVVNQIATSLGGDAPFVAAFSSTGSQLLFSNAFGSANDSSVIRNGVAVDASGNVYFAATTQDTSAAANVTAGAYNQTLTGGYAHTFFGKISPILLPTATVLAISPLNALTGRPITFTATVTGTTQTAPYPTGSVMLTATSGTTVTPLGTLPLGSGGSGSLTSSSLTASTYSVSATYTADGTYDTSTTAAQTLTVTPPAADVLTLTPSASSYTAGTSASFSVTVKSSGTATSTPTGTVYLLDGTATLGSVVLASGSATYTTNALAVGSHSISAQYTGDNIYAAQNSNAQSVTITPVSSSVTLSASPTTATVSSSISLSASVTGTGGTPTGTVKFLNGTTLLAMVTLNTGSASYSVSGLAAGVQSFTAVYSGDATFAGATSAAQTVNIIAPAPTVTLSASPATLTITHGTTGSTVLTATPAMGFNGTLTFSCGTLHASASCGFSSPSLIFTAASSAGQTTTLTVSTTSAMIGLLTPKPLQSVGGAFFASLLLLPASLWARRRRLRLVALLGMSCTAALLAGTITGCSSGAANSTTTTPAGSYTIVVTVAGAPSGTAPLNVQLVVR